MNKSGTTATRTSKKRRSPSYSTVTAPPPPPPPLQHQLSDSSLLAALTELLKSLSLQENHNQTNNEPEPSSLPPPPPLRRTSSAPIPPTKHCRIFQLHQEGPSSKRLRITPDKTQAPTESCYQVMNGVQEEAGVVPSEVYYRNKDDQESGIGTEEAVWVGKNNDADLTIYSRQMSMWEKI